MSRRSTLLFLCVVAAVALALRLDGLQFGLPAVYNPDEIAIMARALTFAKGTLNPENFVYPTFFFYVLFAWTGVYLAVVWLTGRVGSIAELQQLYFTNPTGIYTAGRALGAVSGTATVLLLYRLGSRLLGSRAAGAACVFLAVAPLHVRDSHYIKHDVFATMTVVLVYLAAVRVWPLAPREGPGARETVVAGAVMGMAFATHYYCVFLAVPLAWAIVQGWRTRGAWAVARQFLLAGATSAVAFFVLSPFVVLEPATALRDIAANRQIVVDRAVTGGSFAQASRYLQMLWSDAISAPIVALGAAGAIWMLVQAPARAVLLLAFPLSFFVFITNTFPASRYLNPVLPFVALFAGWCLAEAAARLRAPASAFWIAVIALASLPAIESVRWDRFIRQTDTRTLAQRYIESRVTPGETIAIQPQSAMLSPTRDGLVEALTRNVGGVDAASTKFRLQLSVQPWPAPAYRLIYIGSGGLDAEKVYVPYEELTQGLMPLRNLGVRFVLVKRYNDQQAGTQPFFQALEREGRRIQTFSPYREGTSEADASQVDPFLHNTDTRLHPALERPGPKLELWEISPTPAEK